MPSNDTLIAIAWAIYVLAYVETGRRLALIAYRRTGHPWQWIVPGRWLLALSYLTMALPFLDAVRLRSRPGWLEPHWAADLSSDWVVVIRYIPVPFLIWTVWRIRRQGLLNDGRPLVDVDERTVSALERTAAATESIAESST